MFGNTRDWSRIHTDYRPGHSGNDPRLIKGNYWQQVLGETDNNGRVITGNHTIAGLGPAPGVPMKFEGRTDSDTVSPEQRPCSATGSPPTACLPCT